jgi:hypothetical protein
MRSPLNGRRLVIVGAGVTVVLAAGNASASIREQWTGAAPAASTA